LVWLPSPMGDAVLCTPALRAIRRHFASANITFFARPVVREVLSPGNFNDRWLELHHNSPFAIAKELKEHKFTHAIVFKNSFGSALAVFLAGISSRIGYAREGRGFLLTEKLYPPKLPDGKFMPFSMLDYYLAIASWLGADTSDRSLELLIEPQDSVSLASKLPELDRADRPIVVLVPGGAFGPSKCWPSDRFAKTADWLISNYNATVFVCVSDEPVEAQIAREICNLSKLSLSADSSNLKNKLINIAERHVTLGQLKALFSVSDLVIANDTGPRHIAIAFRRKVISLFGPNDPAWTDTGYENEIQIVGNVPCAPCAKTMCKEKEHLCMQAITVKMVCSAAKELLENNRSQAQVLARPEFQECSKAFFINSDYKTALSKLGLTSIDAIFSFNAAKNLVKNNLAPFRSRLQFQIDSPSVTVFLKRYDSPPILVQLRNWLAARRRISCGLFDLEPTNKLAAAGINTPKIIAYGEQWSIFFEKRSFIITEKIPDAEALERKLPDCFRKTPTAENLKQRRNFISQLASFIRRFHQTGYCHRDLYFSHIFYDNRGNFYLIDLARVFKPVFWRQRFQIKDIAQVYYSAPAKYFSRTDRLRFYLAYTRVKKLTKKDKIFIRKVISKVERMAQHDIKHGRCVPCAC